MYFFVKFRLDCGDNEMQYFFLFSNHVAGVYTAGGKSYKKRI